MKAWQVVAAGEPRDVLRRVEIDPPAPPAGFVRVRMAACALGLPDLFMCRGTYPLTPGHPFTPGQELCGVVSAVGDGARTRVGERVMGVSGFFLGHGGFAAEGLMLDDFALPAPTALDDAEAASFVIPFHTAWVGLVRRAALREGETLLVLGGAGGTGSAAIQLGRALGARVIATARGAERAVFCRQLGADAVVDPSADPLAERVRALTAGRGADVVYDPVGGEAFAQASRCVAHEGRILLVGFASGAWGQPDPGHMAERNYSVVGVMPSGYDRAFREAANQALLSFLARGALRVPVERRLDFEHLPDGLESLASGGVMGKLALLAPQAREREGEGQGKGEGT